MSRLAALLDEAVVSSVDVNQRALVEKILARYSGTFSEYRELLQNADDAGASNVEIHFLSPATPTRNADSPLPELATHKIGRLLVKNNGRVFRDEDWARLKKIAEGNPDEDKIGAFGVGFYSLFSICDAPAVESGDKVMGFFWKDGGDQLFVKQALVPLTEQERTGTQWTSFSMELREQTPMPSPSDFARFLSTSLGFTASIRNISMHFDGLVLCRLSKTLAPPRALSLDAGLPHTSPLKYLKIASTEETSVQIRAQVCNWIRVEPKPKLTTLLADVAASSSFASKMLAAFAKPVAPVVASPTPSVAPTARLDPLGTTERKLLLRIVSASVKVSPTTHFSSEMLRATKKALPKNTTVALIFTSKAESDASLEGGGLGDDIFGGLRSDLEANGKIFIGFATFQTTGCAAAIAARFVSTVERESLDFQSPYCADWNKELLWVAGITARQIYENEMRDLARGWRPTLDTAAKERHYASAAHLLRFFSFSASTPSPVVGTQTQAAFFTTSTKAFTLISTLGPLPSSSVRLPNPQLDEFYQGAVVPSTVATSAGKMMGVLRERNLVRDVSLDDVLADLSTHSLNVETGEALACFKWWASLSSNRSYNTSLLARLKNAAMLSTVPDPSRPEDLSIAPLSSFRSFLNPKIIPTDVPLPPHTLPHALTKSLASNVLLGVFALEELALSGWVDFLVSAAMIGSGAKAATNVTVSPHFAEKVLATLARAWSSVPGHQQARILDLLRPVAFVPTRQGLQVPGSAYFSNVIIFEDLAIVTLPSGSVVKGGVEKLLADLGVRRHVELQLVFTRLLGGGDWSHIQLTKYLVSVVDTLSSAEKDRLKKTAWLPQEGESSLAKGDEAAKSPVVRHTAGQLYEPTEALRALGLPLLDWSSGTTRWRSTSDEAKFLYTLGLQRTPSVATILEIAASTGHAARREAALAYFLADYTNASYHLTYDPAKSLLPAFVPALKDGKSILAVPSQVFLEPGAAILGFAVLQPRYTTEASKFRLASHPSGAELVRALLASPTVDLAQASKTFRYLSSQVSGFTSSQLAALRVAPILPIKTITTSIKVTLTRPDACFFEASDTIPSGVKAFFATISSELDESCRPFLVAVGVRPTPSVVELAQSIVADPKRFLELCGSPERYLGILRLIAVDFQRVGSTLRSQMKTSSCLLGSQRVVDDAAPSKGKKAPVNLLDRSDSEEEDDESTLISYLLVRPDELVIVDDAHSAMLFGSTIVACPQEDALESIAETLGAKKLSALVSERYRSQGDLGETARCAEVRRLLVERTFLFLAERQQTSRNQNDLLHNPEWIKTHLVVCEVQSLELILTLTLPHLVKRHAGQATAFAQKAPGKNGGITLFIANSNELDYYEVAQGICRCILSRQRPNDALLLTTILSTSLKTLKRRGFNVDRILNARRAEKQLAERRVQEEDRERSLNALTPEKLTLALEQLTSMFPDAAPEHLIKLLQAEKKDHLEGAANALVSDGNYPRRRESLKAPPPGMGGARDGAGPNGAPTDKTRTDSDRGVFSSFKRKLLNKPDLPTLPVPVPSTLSTALDSSAPQPNSTRLPPPALGPPRSGMQSRPPSATPTPTPQIRSNLLSAIRASRPDTASSVRSDVRKDTVQELLGKDGGYCDATAGQDLKFVRSVDGIRFFLERDGIDPETFLREHGAGLSRMATQVLLPVGKVFSMDLAALHIFYDRAGPLIAFNRGGSIYFNYRFYLVWHDAQVVAGQRNEALISTFHTLAHEIAHNLVKPHDAEHSFYFSSLCEMHFEQMAMLLGRSEG